MSLSWLDRLHVTLAPMRVQATRTSGLFARQSTSTTLIPEAHGENATPWRAAVDALSEAAVRLAPRGGRCEIVLSNHFCRYLVLPGNDALVNETEVLTYARLQFAAIHGLTAVGAWDIRVGCAAPGEARLACATDVALLDALRELCGRAGLKLAGVKPLLSAAFDAGRAEFRRPSFWFVVEEEGRVCVAAVKRGVWCDVTGERDQSLRAVHDLIDRARLRLADMGEDTVYWHDSEGITCRRVTRLERPRAPHDIAGNAAKAAA